MLAPVAGSFFDTFSGALLKRPLLVFNQIWSQVWLNFGSILGLFWETLRKVKIELSLKRQPHFDCPQGFGNHHFFDLLSERPPEHSPEPLLGVIGSILARFGRPLGSPLQAKMASWSPSKWDSDFEVEKRGSPPPEAFHGGGEAGLQLGGGIPLREIPLSGSIRKHG